MRSQQHKLFDPGWEIPSKKERKMMAKVGAQVGRVLDRNRVPPSIAMTALMILLRRIYSASVNVDEHEANLAISTVFAQRAMDLAAEETVNAASAPIARPRYRRP